MSKKSAAEADPASETVDSQQPLIDEPRIGDAVISTNGHIPDEAGRKMGRGWPRCCAISGLVFAVIGAVLALTFPLLYHALINYEMSLQNGTMQYKSWTDPPVAMYTRFYLFNVTNGPDVAENRAKPILQQLGPYTYRERHYRLNIQPHENNTLTYQQRRVWHFVPEMSNGTLEDNITSLNVPLMGAVYAMRFQSVFHKVGLNRIVDGFGIGMFVTKTARELLFDGYDDPLLNLAQRLPPGTFPPYDRFAWFYGRNNSDTYDGVFNIFTGADRIDRFGDLDMWNYTRQTKYYESYCGMVNGSFGEGWAPRRNKSSISMYITDICRSVTLDYAEDVVNHGVSSYRFVGSERLFSNSTDYPDNWCFCSGGVCNPSGVGNSSTCRYGAPVFVSFPHFYLADPYYADMVEGLNATKEDHEFHIDLQPDLAVPTSVRARLQISILIEPVIDIDVVENLNRTYVPLVWFEVAADLNEELGSRLNLVLNLPVIGTATFFGIFCISVLAVTVSGIVLLKRRSRTHDLASAGPPDARNINGAIIS